MKRFAFALRGQQKREALADKGGGRITVVSAVAGSAMSAPSCSTPHFLIRRLS
jgi:hypothetical protein